MLEPTFLPTPYSAATAPSSAAIRALLDQQEDEYLVKRATRKPIRHAIAGPVLNRPITMQSNQDKHAQKDHTSAFLPKSSDKLKPLTRDQRRQSLSQAPPMVRVRHNSLPVIQPCVMIKPAPEKINAEAKKPTRHGSIRDSRHFLIIQQQGSDLCVLDDASSTDNDLSPREAGRSPHIASARRPKRDKVKDIKAQQYADEEDIAMQRLAATGISSKKRLQEYLYDFHSHQVFSLLQNDGTHQHEDQEQLNTSASNEDDDEHEDQEDDDEDDDEYGECDSDLNDDDVGDRHDEEDENGSNNGVSDDEESASDCPRPFQHHNRRRMGHSLQLLGQQHKDGSLGSLHSSFSLGLSTRRLTMRSAPGIPLGGFLLADEKLWFTPEDYSELFDFDWERAHVEKLVRDAVERRRIEQIFKPCYRIFIWYFRHYAASTGLLSPLAEPFRVEDKTKFMQDLNMPTGDWGKYTACLEAPLRRQDLVTFVINVCRMHADLDEDGAHKRQVFAEGIEFSESMTRLVTQHFFSFAQIQDVNHFRRVFLNRYSFLSQEMDRLLKKHRPKLIFAFREYANGSKRKEFAVVDLMGFGQFLALLRSTDLTGGSADETRALRAFIASIAPFDRRNRDKEIKQATFDQFLEASCRFALYQHESLVCKGGFDMCPMQVDSEWCLCDPIVMKSQYDWPAFLEAVDKTFTRMTKKVAARQRLRRSSLVVETVQKLSRDVHVERAPTR